MDEDLKQMSMEELMAEAIKLRQGIRKHRDSQGHNLCWYVPELWGLLPENYGEIPQVPEVCEFIENCVKYRKSLGK